MKVIKLVLLLFLLALQFSKLALGSRNKIINSQPNSIPYFNDQSMLPGNGPRQLCTGCVGSFPNPYMMPMFYMHNPFMNMMMMQSLNPAFIGYRDSMGMPYQPSQGTAPINPYVMQSDNVIGGIGMMNNPMIEGLGFGNGSFTNGGDMQNYRKNSTIQAQSPRETIDQEPKGYLDDNMNQAELDITWMTQGENTPLQKWHMSKKAGNNIQEKPITNVSVPVVNDLKSSVVQNDPNETQIGLGIDTNLQGINMDEDKVDNEGAKIIGVL